MTNANQKAKIRKRMADTGEPYMEARRRILEEQAAREAASKPAGNESPE